MKYIVLVSFLLVIAFCFGCSESDEKVGASGPPETFVKGVKTAPAKLPIPAGKMQVSILPHSPAVRDDLQVVVSGAGEVRDIRWYRDGMLIQAASSDVLPKHSFLKGEEVSVDVTTEKGTGSARKVIGNTPPDVIAVDFLNPYVQAGSPLEVNPEGIDEDGDYLEYRCVWAVNGEILPGETGTVLSPRYFRKGDRLLVQVYASDGEAEGPPFVGEEFVIPNAPPVFVTTPPMEFSDRTYEYNARAEDPDGDPLHYRLEEAPPGMRISDAGDVFWLVETDSAGDHQIRIVAEDDEGAKAVQNYTFRISFSEGRQ